MYLVSFLLILVTTSLALAQLDGNGDYGKCPHLAALAAATANLDQLPTPLLQKLDFNSIFAKQLPGGLNQFGRMTTTAPELEEFGILHRDNYLSPSIAARFAKHTDSLTQAVSDDAHQWDQYASHSLLNLVDPSLYTFVSGVTRIQPESGGKLSVGYLKQETTFDPEYSSNYQLLPTDFYVDPHSREVEIKSYINNLHPRRYPELYEDVRSIFGNVLPLMEKSLGKVTKTRSPINLAARTLQVVINIKGVHLSKDKNHFRFPGSEWHTEGLKNEHIIATAIYYYDVENVTQSNIQFKLDYSERYSTNNNNKTEEQEFPLGEIHCKTGRIVVFPNVYHHRVNPYQLQAETDSGHRKILVFFLLDPNRLIPSTSTVPPQQMNWYVDAAEYAGTKRNWPYGIEKALEYRNEFNAERRQRKCCGGGRLD